MNVNIWGPDFWNVIHGICILTTNETADISEKLLEKLKYLLPCIFCLKSYREFYDSLFKEKTLKSYFLEDKGAEISYEIHNLVNVKLLNQKSQVIAQNNSLLEKRVKETFTLLTKTNFLKRVQLYGIYPINVHSIWRMLLILSVALDIADEIETPNNRLNETYEFMVLLSQFFVHTTYSDFAKSLSSCIRSVNNVQNPRQLFVILSFFQDTNSTNPISLKYLDKLKKYNELFDTYKDNLVASKCSINTCQ